MQNNPFRPKLIVGTLPVTLQNGTTADATQVMADLNWIVNQVNANVPAFVAAIAATLSGPSGSSQIGFIQAGAHAVQRNAQSKMREIISVGDDGALGDGATDATAAFNNIGADIAAAGIPVKLTIAPGNYLISGTVNWDLPERSVVDAEGAVFTFSHDGVCFDLNPTATAAIPNATGAMYKRSIHWHGGQFLCTAATRTASVAIQGYMMSMFTVSNVAFGADNSGSSPYAAIKIAGADTYRFIDCRIFDCVRHVWVPAAGVVFAANNTALDLIDVEFRGCHFASSGTGNEAAIFFENRATNVHINGGSINGVFTVAHARFQDNATASSRCIAINGGHFEQMDANKPAILFVDAGGKGLDTFSVDAGTKFLSSTSRWQGITLARTSNWSIGSSKFTDGSTGVVSFAISVDANCRGGIIDTKAAQFSGFMDTFTVTGAADNGATLIRLQFTNADRLATGDRVFVTGVLGTVEANGMWVVTAVDSTHVDLQGSLFANPWSAGGTQALRLMNVVKVSGVADRKYITMLPEIVVPTTPQVLTNYNGVAKGTVNPENVNMALNYPNFVIGVTNQTFPTYLWPKGYHFSLSYSDSGSLGAGAGSSQASLLMTTFTVPSVRVSTRALPNDTLLCNSGYVPADDSGNVDLRVAATGVGTSTVTLHCSAFTQ